MWGDQLATSKFWRAALTRQTEAVNGSHLLNFHLSLSPFSLYLSRLSLQIHRDWTTTFVTAGVSLHNEKSNLDINHLCPQLPTKSQLFSTAAAPSRSCSKGREEVVHSESSWNRWSTLVAMRILWLSPHYYAVFRVRLCNFDTPFPTQSDHKNFNWVHIGVTTAPVKQFEGLASISVIWLCHTMLRWHAALPKYAKQEFHERNLKCPATSTTLCVLPLAYDSFQWAFQNQSDDCFIFQSGCCFSFFTQIV